MCDFLTTLVKKLLIRITIEKKKEWLEETFKKQEIKGKRK